MAVPMQVNRVPAHIAPGAEGIVAKHEPPLIQHQLSVWLYARPVGQRNSRSDIVVAGHEMFVAVKLVQEFDYSSWRLSNSEISQVPYLILPPYNPIPPLNHCRIHLRYGRERASIEG